MTPTNATNTTSSSTVYAGAPGWSDSGSRDTTSFQAGVARRPSKLTETSNISTKVSRLTDASNGRWSPPKNPRVPGVPNRK